MRLRTLKLDVTSASRADAEDRLPGRGRPVSSRGPAVSVRCTGPACGRRPAACPLPTAPAPRIAATSESGVRTWCGAGAGTRWSGSCPRRADPCARGSAGLAPADKVVLFPHMKVGCGLCGRAVATRGRNTGSGLRSKDRRPESGERPGERTWRLRFRSTFPGMRRASLNSVWDVFVVLGRKWLRVRQWLRPLLSRALHALSLLTHRSHDSSEFRAPRANLGACHGTATWELRNPKGRGSRTDRRKGRRVCCVLRVFTRTVRRGCLCN